MEEKNQCRVVVFLAKMLKKDDEKFEKEEKLCPAVKKKDHKYQNHNQSDHIFKFFISSISVLLLLIISVKLKLYFKQNPSGMVMHFGWSKTVKENESSNV